ncbi:PstS family phosphate ABC transporter substrate-binding protein [Novipirellula artificiosorum]|uniref:Phosphate-binding protein n=1 Tax=Novipirellula artificiosorum TaxID=2528016 RepID=A0A5C6E423_9BACT|nr:PstS family phosphate ABC transporter substrate-binding protein [Novipirellula artificiosorum]TWU42737.1 Phosphate-binding protein PstS precursor [Novipirellula artificiosorum]
MKRESIFHLMIALVAITLGSRSVSAQNSGLLGRVEIDGSSTVYPISEAAASGFTRAFPKVKVNVGVSGTGGGFKRFTVGQTDISDASRPIKATEFEAAKDAGVDFFELPVAYDGLTLVVHKGNNWVDHLTIDEIKKIFTSSGAAKTWAEVRQGWPNNPIQIFAPGTDSGTFDYFKEVVAGDDGSLRSDMSTSEDDNVLVTGVSGSPNAIGFFGVAYYEENKDKLKSVAIVNPELKEPVLPTAATIEKGTYAPFSRPLFIYINARSFRRPEVRQFVAYYLKNAADLATQTGYVPLPKSVYAEAMNHCRQGKTGTHYLTKDMEKRSGAVTEIYTTETLVN